MHPRVNIKTIVIALLDKLAAYAAREAENESVEAANVPPPTPAKVDEAEKTDGTAEGPTSPTQQDSEKPSTNGQESEKATENGTTGAEKTEQSETNQTTAKPKVSEVKKYRGIPEDVKLFEVFWHQVVELIRARPDLTIQDVTALLVSLIGLSLSCYPDRIDYVDQVLTFAKGKVDEYHNR